MTRRRPRRAPRCSSCGALVVFWRDSDTNKWRPFAVKPLPAHEATGRGARPVWQHRAWNPGDLAAELASTPSVDDPHETIAALDWYLPHLCRVGRPHDEEEPLL